MIFQGGQFQGSGTINGSLTIGTDATLTMAADSGLISASSLQINSGGSVNLGNNELVLNFGGGSDPKSQILQYLKSGYDGGKWDGSGINSSLAAISGGAYAVGFADGADGVVAGLANGQIELKYTLNGDANLDGAVNGTDFAILASNFNKGVTGGWDQGDFDYSGSVNGTDFAELAANFNKGATLNPPGLSPAQGASYTITGTVGSQVLDVTGGTITLTDDLSTLLPNYILRIENSAHVILTSSQHLGGIQLVGNGTLDIGKYAVLLNYDIGTDPKSTLLQYLKSGCNGGQWNGAGIMSSAATSSGGSYGVGFVDGGDHLSSSLTSAQIEIAYALNGDANLDGSVNGSDFAILAANFNKGVTNGWEQGDFNYDGSVNGTDFAALAANFNKGSSIATFAIAAEASSVVESTASEVVSSSGADTATSTLTQASNDGPLSKDNVSQSLSNGKESEASLNNLSLTAKKPASKSTAKHH